MPAEHFPRYARWALDGRLKLADLSSSTLVQLHEVNDAFAAMKHSDILRAVARFP
jgi:Zn-dependent alcohol dehydrogenase